MNQALIDKIRKILLKTEEAGCTRSEAEAAFAMAQRLLLENNLSMDDISAKEAESTTEWVEEEADNSGRWTNEMNMTYHLVQEHCMVRGLLMRKTSASGKSSVSLYLFGTKENAAVARQMFKSLLSACDRLWIDYRVKRQAPASDRRAYYVGVIKGFSDKLTEERKVVEMEQDVLRSRSSGYTEIVLQSVQQKTMEKFNEKHGKMNSSRNNFAPVGGSRSAVQDGYQAGRNLSLNQPIAGPSRKGIGR
jgi:hypothetical protein